MDAVCPFLQWSQIGELQKHTMFSDEAPDPHERAQVWVYQSLPSLSHLHQFILELLFILIHSRTLKLLPLRLSCSPMDKARAAVESSQKFPWNPWVILGLVWFCVFIFPSVLIAWIFPFAKGFNQQQMFWIRLKPKYLKSYVFILSCWVQSYYLASEGQCKAIDALMNSLQQTGVLMVNSDEHLL